MAKTCDREAAEWELRAERIDGPERLFGLFQSVIRGCGPAALLPDSLWDLVEPFLPIPPCRPRGGRPRVSDRACLIGILFVLRSGIPWQMLPQELGCASG